MKKRAKKRKKAKPKPHMASPEENVLFSEALQNSEVAHREAMRKWANMTEAEKERFRKENPGI